MKGIGATVPTTSTQARPYATPTLQLTLWPTNENGTLPSQPNPSAPPPPFNLGLFIMFVPDYAVISAICHTATSRCGCCGRGQLPKKWARQTKNIDVLTRHTLTKNTRVQNTSAKCAYCFVFFVFGLNIVKRKPQ